MGNPYVSSQVGLPRGYIPTYIYPRLSLVLFISLGFMSEHADTHILSIRGGWSFFVYKSNRVTGKGQGGCVLS